jgi:hypothetical protein
LGKKFVMLNPERNVNRSGASNRCGYILSEYKLGNKQTLRLALVNCSTPFTEFALTDWYF